MIIAKSRKEVCRVFAMVLGAAVLCAALGVQGAQKVYTTDGDFDEGTLTGVEHLTAHDQLQIAGGISTLPYIWVPNENETVSKIDTATGRELARYKTGPDGFDGEPSRTTVDLQGDCWVANRYAGSVVKIGLREAGKWLDRNSNGVADTSFDANGDGDISDAEVKPWGQDECVLVEVIVIEGRQGTYTPGTYSGGYPHDWTYPGPRSVAVDRNNNLWVGCYGSQKFYYIDGVTGKILSTNSVASTGHTAYGAVIDASGVLWSSGFESYTILRLDPNTTPIGISAISMPHRTYGVGLDYQGYLFASAWTDSKLARINTATGTRDWSQDKGELYQARGVAATPDNTIWVASTANNAVYRYTSNGTHLATVGGLNQPTGVAVDNAGKVWVADVGDEYVHRINPANNAIDLSKRIVGSGGHYTYSDMTGIVARNLTARRGVWTAVYDAGAAGAPWVRVAWVGSEPSGSRIEVQVRAADSVADLQNRQFTPATNGMSLAGLGIAGRYIETSVTLVANEQGTVSPVLQALSLNQITPEISWPVPTNIVYGTLLGAGQLAATSSVPGAVVYQPAVGALLGAGTHVLSARFTPADPLVYSSVTTTVALVVQKAGLGIRAEDKSKIYKTANPSLTAVYTGFVANETPAVLSPAAGLSTTAVLASPVGNYPITVSGAGSSNYLITYTAGTLTVTPAAPALTWTNPAPIWEGVAIGAAQLNATASVPGGFNYTPPSGTVLSPGTNTLTTVFTPADSLNYSAATSQVTLWVKPLSLEDDVLFVNVRGGSYDGDGYNFYQTLPMAGARATYVNLSSAGMAAALISANRYDQIWVFDLSSGTDSYPADWAAIGDWFNARTNRNLICDGRSISSLWQGRWQNEGKRLTQNYYENLKREGGGLVLATDHSAFQPGINSINDRINVQRFSGDFSLTYIPIDTNSPLMNFPNNMGTQLLDDSSPGQTPFGLQPNGLILYSAAWHSGNTNTPGVSSTFRGGVGFQIALTSPASGSLFNDEAPVTLSVQQHGGVAPITYSWRSDRDGALGSGATLVVSNLSVGAHQITVVGQDSAGAADSASVAVTIQFVAPALTLRMQPASDSGASATDNLTTNNRPVFEAGINKRGQIELDATGDGLADVTLSNLAAGTYLAVAPLLADGARAIVARFVPVHGTALSATQAVTIDTLGARVTTVAPAAGAVLNQPFSQAEIEFDSAMDPATLTAGALSLSGPSGPVTISSIIPLNARRYRLLFPVQTGPGSYTIQVGTGARDLAGNLLDQNGNGVNGEAAQDAFQSQAQLLLADLFTGYAQAPASFQAGVPAPVVWAVTNLGGATAQVPWTETIRLAGNAAGTGGQLVLSLVVTQSLAPGEGLIRTQAVVMPVGIDGQYWLVWTLDTPDAIPEGAGETNNVYVQAAPVRVYSPDLIVETVTVSASPQFGGSADVTWTVRNAGQAPAQASWYDRVFFSRTTGLAGALTLVSSVTGQALAPGAAYTRTQTVSLPLDRTWTAGDYYVLVTTDQGASQAEVLENNNTTNSAAIHVVLPPLPDLAVSGIHAPGTAVAGELMVLSWTVTNRDAGTATGPWVERVYTCDDASGSGARLLASLDFSGRLRGGESLIRTQRVMTPVSLRGARFVAVETDATDVLFESVETNNLAVAAQSTAVVAADLVVQSVLVAPSTAALGQPVLVTWVVQNTGDGPANAGWDDDLALVSDAQPGLSVPLGRHASVAALPPGGRYTNQVSVIPPLSSALPPGGYRIVASVDILNVQVELAETNNTGSAALSLSLPPLADLAVSGVAVLKSPSGEPVARILPGETVLVTWTTTNQGAAAAAGPWSETVALTGAPALSNGLLLATFSFTNTLAAGQGLVHTQSVTLPMSSPAGALYFGVIADSQNSLVEPNETNNTGWAESPVPMALVLTLVLNPSTVWEGAAIQATVSRNGDHSQPLTVTVTNGDPAQVQTPVTVLIPAGQVSAAFNLAGVADGLLDGPQSVSVGVVAAGFDGDSKVVRVMDADVPRLAVRFETNRVREGRTVAATVSVVPAPAQDLRLQLISSRPSQLLAPASVTIGSNQSTAAFAVLAAADTLVELDMDATLVASASGFAAGSATITIEDANTPALSLSLDRLVASEGAGSSAAQGVVTRAVAAAQPLGVLLSSSDPGVQVPAQVQIPAGETSAAFALATVDDLVIQGARQATVRACAATTVDQAPLPGCAQAVLTVYDNDGPSLVVTSSRDVVAEGLRPAAPLTVTRALGLETNLVVALLSDNLGELIVPASVTILAGASNAQFTAESVQDSVIDGSKTVVVSASAEGFNTGLAAIVVTDSQLPDLVIAKLDAPANAVAGETFTMSFELANRGLAGAAATMVQRAYLSTNALLHAGATVLGDFPYSGALPVEQSVRMAQTYYAPVAPGLYYVIVAADVSNAVAEVAEQNNLRVSAVPMRVGPSYQAAVETDVDFALAGSAVPLRGLATRFNGSPAAYETVVIYVEVRGASRMLTVISDATGHFATLFNPLPGEGGFYTVSAAPPLVPIPPAQDSFSLVGFKAGIEFAAHRLAPLTSVTGRFQLQNLSEVPLTGLAGTISGLPSGLQASLDVTNAIPGQGSVTVDYTIRSTADENAASTFKFVFTTSEGAQVELPVHVLVEPLRPSLSVAPASMTMGLVRGQQRLIPIEVVNTGAGATGPLSLSLPDVAWMHVASTNPAPAVAPGQTNVFMLQLIPAADLALGEFNGSFFITDGTATATIPFHFKVVSAALGDLSLTTVDESTYYGQNPTNLGGVSLVLRDPFSGEVVARGVSGADGVLFLPDLPEGAYNLEATAPKHDTTTMTVSVQPGQVNPVTVFLRTQLVRYTWTVEEIEIEDRYTVTLDTVFETYVPTPVVTIEPSVLDLATIQGDEGQFLLTVTNHGLVAANAVKIHFESHPVWELVPLISDVGVLPARSGLTVPVTARRISGGLAPLAGNRHAKGGTGVPCTLSGGLDWLLICGPFGITYNVPIPVIHASGDCDFFGSGGGWGGGGGGGGGGWGGWGGGSTGGGGPSFSAVVPVYAPTNKCACDTNTFVEKCVSGESGLEMDLSAVASAIQTVTPPWLKVDGVKIKALAGGQICDCCENNIRGLKATVSGNLGVEVVFKVGFAPEFEMEIALAGYESAKAKASMLAGAELTLSGTLSATLGTECFLRDPKACITGTLAAGLFVGVKGGVELTATAGGQEWGGGGSLVFGLESGVSISISGCTGEGLKVKGCFNGLTAKAGGELSLSRGNIVNKVGVTLSKKLVEESCYPPDKSSKSTVPFLASATPDQIAQWAGFANAQQMALARGVQAAPPLTVVPGSAAPGTSMASLPPRRYTLNALPPRPAAPERAVGAVAHAAKGGESGVCAQVRLQIEQQVTFTRKAIGATLEVINESDTSAIEQLMVAVTIYDDAGNVANDKFVLLAPELTQITVTDPGGSIGDLTLTRPAWRVAAATTGRSRWVILPKDEAAADGPTVYRVGGYMTYLAGGTPGSATFTPAPVTVYPNARLVMKYFHQRDVFSDDPFTPEIEPSVPFNLAVMVQNIGRGEAKNFTIASSQPKIVENMKGLLIGFEIIATEVAGKPMTPGLVASFGNLGPGDIQIGRWLMKSTLQGLFVDYKASFTHEDSLGGKATSLLESVDIHEMNHLVYAAGSFDDGLPDFLVNDQNDPNDPLDLPDTIYLSDGSTNPVAVLTSGSFAGAVSAANLSTDLSVAAPAGWVYVRLADPSGGQFPLRRIVRSDGVEILVSTNAWTTDRTFVGMGKPPVREAILHLLDFDSTGSYTVFFGAPAAPDTLAPSSRVAALPASSSATIPVSWSGSDNDGGSGIAAYDVYVSVNGGPSLVWLAQTRLNSATYNGAASSRYAFFSVATDNSGNREPAHAAPDAETLVDRTNHAPVITPIAAQAVDESTTFALDVVATDADGDSLTYSVLDGPAGLQIDARTGRLTWVTSEATGPVTVSITVKAEDTGSPALSATNTFSLTVREVNAAPGMPLIADQTIGQGQLLRFYAAASDGDLPPQSLAFSLQAGAPEGATVDPATGLFLWQPGAAQAGRSYPLTVVVRDDGQPPLSASRAFTVTVTNTGAADLQITRQPQSIDTNAEAAVEFSVEATGTAPLSYQWQFKGVPVGGAVSNTLSLTNVQKIDEGAYTVVVSNAAGSVTSEVATLTVRQPTVARPDQLGAVSGVPATGSVTKFLANDLHDTGVVLSIASYTQPVHGSVSIAGDVVTYTSTPGFVGKDTWTYTLNGSSSTGLTASVTMYVASSAHLYGANIIVSGVRDGHFWVRFAGVPGKTYDVESTADVVNGPWELLTRATAARNGLYEVVDTVHDPAQGQRYYRAVYR